MALVGRARGAVCGMGRGEGQSINDVRPGTKNNHVIREVACIKYCISVPNADNGGFKIPKNLWTSFMDGPRGEENREQGGEEEEEDTRKRAAAAAVILGSRGRSRGAIPFGFVHVM